MDTRPPPPIDLLPAPNASSLGKRPAASLRYAIQRTIHARREPAVACWGPDHVMFAINAEALRLLTNATYPLGTPFRDAYPELAPTLVPLLDAAFAGRPCGLGESTHWIERPGGARAEYYTSMISPLPGADGEILGTLWNFADVSAQVRNARMLHAVLRQTELRFVQVNVASLTVEWASPAAWRGQVPDASLLAGRPAADLLPPAVVTALAAAAEASSPRCLGAVEPGTCYTVFPLARSGATPQVLVLAHPA